MEPISAITNLRVRLAELEAQLSDAKIIADLKRFRELSSEYALSRETLELADHIDSAERELAETRVMMRDSDPELARTAEEESNNLQVLIAKLKSELNERLNPADPFDSKSIIMELRAGTGGDESALFAAELFRMYSLYAERQNWKTALISASRSDLGGYKEVIFQINGRNVYSKLKWESGVHRVQRVPETEKAGRVHTSTVTVAVLPKLEPLDFDLDAKDLKIETSTSGGHGGQSVNTTYSAIRMTHLPTGITVSCQDERSQTQNRERALEVMRARVFQFYEDERNREHRDRRRAQIGSGDRSEKIRTYNFPQDRLTDHRLKESWHNLAGIMDGSLDDLIGKLKEAEQALNASENKKASP